MKFLNNLDVRGYITQSNTIDTMLKADASGKLVAAVAGVDYAAPGSGGGGSTLSHDVKLGEAINKGQAVYVSGSNGTNMIVSKASNSSEATSSKTLGLIDTTGILNDPAKVITEGLIEGIDTSSANAGDPVWLGTNGNLIFGLANKPTAPSHLVYLGVVTRVQQNNGEIFVNVQNGFETNELHDVISSGRISGDVMYWDGSINRYASISSVLGYTPYNETNPSGYITSASLTWANISGKPTALSQFTNDSGFITSSGSITGSANSLNLGGHTISSSSWAGGSGYHGYTYNGGNFRFGFSSTSGVVDVYADGNFYATDSSHIVLHNGNKSSYIDTLYYGGNARLWTGSDGTRNSGWAYHTDNGTGVHWPNNGWHLYPENGNDFWWRSGNSTESTIHFSKGGNAGGYIHNSSSNDIGFLSTGRSWIFRVTNGGDAYTTSTHYAAGYRGTANVGGTGEATWHPAGIYCGSTMWQYGTQYRNGNTTSGQGWTYLDWNYGHSVVGVYSASRYQGVWAMGDAYKLAADGTSPSNLYGICWSHPNAGGQAGYLTNHGLIHMMYGTAFATISDNIWCRNNITAYSDIRVKENIEVIPNAMEKINAIRGVTFTRNDVPDKSKRHVGVIAQEIEKVLPEVITKNESNGHLSVAYGNITALTIEGLKEHDVTIKQQQRTINLLLEQVKYLNEVINGFTK